MTSQAGVPEASFNQAGFSQIRLHELFLRIDRLNINPLDFSQEFKANHYEIMLRDLSSIFSTISSKLTKEDLDNLLSIRAELMNLLKEKPIFSSVKREGYTKAKFNSQNWDLFYDKLFIYRIEIEKALDKYGFGNPSKADPRKAIISN